jgi:hypothetical protein
MAIGNTEPARWLPTSEAAAALNCSVSTLQRMRRVGLLQPGLHWRRIAGGRRAPVIVDVAAAEELLRLALAG